MRALVILAAFVAVAFAPQPATALTAQQEKMKTCNVGATAQRLKGAERKTFMSRCLSSEREEPKKLNAQQQKMRDCNAKAGSMKGAERRTFMSSCLKG